MVNVPPTLVFYHVTDPETARNIADRGFAGSDVWSAQSTLTLLDQVPRNKVGSVLRVSLPPELAAETMRRESSDPSEGYRKFLVPMELLRYADVTLEY